MKKILVVVLCIILVVVLGGMYVANMKSNDKSNGIEAKYDFSNVQRMDLSEKVDAAGNVILSRNMDIYPSFESTVVKISAKASDSIKKGDLLLTLDSPIMESQWTEANSTYRQAEINLSQARKDLQRTKILFEAQGVTVDQVEAAQSQVDIYQEQFQAARVKLEQIKTLPDGANFIDTNHRYLLIRAPLTGSVAWVNVKPGDKVSTQTVLLSLTTENSLEIEAKIDESEIATVHSGQKAIIFSNDLDNTQIDGVVSEVGKIGAEEAGVVNFPVRVKVLGGNQILKNGMSVDVTVITSSLPNVLAVPSNAVVERRGKTMVAVRDNAGVSFVRVETGVKSGTNVQILSGLKAGDVIAIEKPKLTTPNTNTNNNRNGMRFGPFGR